MGSQELSKDTEQWRPKQKNQQPPTNGQNQAYRMDDANNSTIKTWEGEMVTEFGIKYLVN